MPRVKVTTELEFSAAHRLFNPEWTEERNQEVFGGCANPNWHGHNYELQVTVEGQVNPATGFVIDFRDLKSLVDSRVIEDLDHRNLDLDVPWLTGIISSAENLVVAIWARLVDGLPEGVELSKLILWETPRSFVEYTGE
jgi:6-pyruvoyltetrahydropterin/6-carboxytetrahydropterin synthase